MSLRQHLLQEDCKRPISLSIFLYLHSLSPACDINFHLEMLPWHDMASSTTLTKDQIIESYRVLNFEPSNV